MAAPASTDMLVDLIRKSGVIGDERVVDGLRADLPPEPTAAAAALVRKGVITRFQATMLLAGKSKGFRLGEYVIQNQIGTGGMGAVFQAVHSTLGRKVAIKVLSGTAAGDQISQERFIREARTAAALDHPNVVKLYDICKQGDVRFLVMEFVEGQDLGKLIKSGGIAPNRAVNYIAQAAAGLQHAYEKGFIHRDIKPGNLILTADGTVKILDMGLARSNDQSDSLTERLDAGAVVGTADYLSPEQAMNHPDVDIRSDIYSLGVTFYALVLGRPPFEGTTASKLIKHQLTAPPSLAELDRTFPHELAEIVAKMMEKKPADRFQTPADVIDALEPWLSDSVSFTGPASERVTKTRLTTKVVRGARIPWYKKPPAIIAGTAGVVVTVGVIAAVALLGGGGKKKPDKQVVATQTQTQTTDPTPAESSAKPPAAKPKPKNWVEGKVIYTLDLSAQKPFELDGVANIMSNKTGDGAFPTGWQVVTWKAGDKAKGFADTKDGPAIGSRAVTGNAILMSPEIPLPNGFVRVRIEYTSSASDKLCTVRLREMGQTKTENENLRTVGEWATFEHVYDATAFKSAARIEFHNSDAGTELRIRSLQVTAVEEK